MMRFFPLILLLCVVFFSCDPKSDNQTKLMPQPQPVKTIVKADMEDYHHKEARNKWFDLLHTAAPGTDWKEIERTNMLNTFAERQEAAKNITYRDEDIEIANGRIQGKWIERGSNNQAGSVLATTFDATNDKLYCVSAGGTIWKGSIDGNSWEVINQDVQFGRRFLSVTRDSADTQYIVAAIENVPYYSVDEGKTWTQSSGITYNDGNNISKITLINTNELFFLAKRNYDSDIKLYYSSDYGKSFTEKETFYTSNMNNLYLTSSEADDVYVIEQLAAQQSRIHKWDNQSKTIETYVDNTPVGFGGSGRANLAIHNIADTLRFLLYDDDSNIKVSLDTAKTWTTLGTIPTTPWQVGMKVNEHDHNILQTGGVDGYRSTDGGETWNKINGWAEYYDDPVNKLHADMMWYDEFMNSDSIEFSINTNHGGVYISYDNGKNYKNISTNGLNVSQYYSVRTSPFKPNYVFAGSQDQGLQRGEVLTNEETANLNQIISGDYGHITFTNEGRTLWTVYPYGWITAYSSAIYGNITADLTVNPDDNSVWIPQIIADPDKTKDIVYAAGGYVNGNSGSHIIKLELKDSYISRTQYPFDFSVSGGSIAAMAIDPFNKNNWFVTTTNRKFYRSVNSGLTFEEVALQVPNDHYLYGNKILASEDVPGNFYIAGSGYSNSPILQSIDGGNTWNDISNGLPPTTILDIALSKNDNYIYAATQAGPYMYVANESTWYPMDGGIAPAQTYWSVEVVPDQDKIVRFGTYGRGIWDFNITQDTTTTNTSDLILTQDDIILYPNPATHWLTVQSNDFSMIDIISIYDVKGNKVLENKNIPSGDRVNIEILNSGTYYISMTIGGKQISKPFIKQ